MSVERLNSPEQLIGKSIIEVISLLPTFSWHIDCGGRVVQPRIVTLSFVDHDTRKPRIGDDVYGLISVTPGESIERRKLFDTLAAKPGRTTGIISMVHLDSSYVGMEKKLAHLPLIDIDLDVWGLSQEETLGVIKREIKEKTEIDKGVILASGGDNHFHFIGTERLLSEEQLVTFLGLCLSMRGPRNELLVDPKWVGHALTPMKYIVELNKKWSVYDYVTRFATLRVTTSQTKPRLPTVVGVLGR